MASLIYLFHPLTFLDIGQIIVRVRAFKKQKVHKEGRKPRKEIWRPTFAAVYLRFFCGVTSFQWVTYLRRSDLNLRIAMSQTNEKSAPFRLFDDETNHVVLKRR